MSLQKDKMENTFSVNLMRWYARNKRVLPWRTNNSPYHVLISEFMLQQTQVPRVIEKFTEFIDLFPTLQDLATASTADVIEAWSGLGYNRRALLLHTFAQEVCEKYDGEIPQNKEELSVLPGMGPYTTGA
ncbi:MAG: A/G-specific adenine glycosylase, partial [Nanoarchaeota archaeon]|nr:A/G-specific adenine glycosylase [Nanoarchaeota archaeon]